MRLTLLLSALLLLVCFLGCGEGSPRKAAPDSTVAQKEPPKVEETPSPPKESPPLEWRPTAIAAGVPAHLAPVTYDATVKVLPVAEVWANLYANLVKDADAQALFKRLHGDVPVTLVALEAKAAAERGDSPPSVSPAPAAVHLALRETKGREATGDAKCHIVTISYLWFQAPPRRSWQPSGDDRLKVYLLLVNDYLLRNRSGYFLRHGTGDVDEGPTAKRRPYQTDPAELRKEVDRDIEELVKRYKL